MKCVLSERERERKICRGCIINIAVEHALELAVVNMFDIFVSVVDGAKWLVQVCGDADLM